MKNVVERQLIKITDDLIVKRGYVERVVDVRPDWVVKTEMWHEICKDRHISLVVDDRNQVVRRARMLGLKVAQVEYGNF